MAFSSEIAGNVEVFGIWSMVHRPSFGTYIGVNGECIVHKIV